jgi:hypothetical protein
MRLKIPATMVALCVLPALLVALCMAAMALTAATALALNPERHYEQVSAGYKGGQGVGTLLMVSGDGEKAAFDSIGVFAGLQWNSISNKYLAQRVGGVGWSMSSLQPPPIGAASGFSPTMEYVIGGTGVGQTNAEGQSTGFEYLLHRVDSPNIPANWEVFGGIALTLTNGKLFTGLALGESSDLCHKVLGLTPQPGLLPEAEKTVDPIYDMSRGCGGGAPGLRLVAVNNAGTGSVINPSCGVDLGVGLHYAAPEQAAAGGDAQSSTFNTINTDGSMIFFTTSLKADCAAHQLFARLGGERTIELSKPLTEECSEVPCAGSVARPSASFKGASEDGSRVYFATKAPLVEGDKDTANDLYLATIGCGEGEAGCGVAQRHVVSLVQVSHDPVAGQSAGVLGVLRIARDGSRVYFVAHGVLSEGPNAEGHAPVNGADNLYVYDTETGRTAFIADLCSGPVLSGSVEDLACPAELSEAGNDSALWNSQTQEIQSTPDGGVLVFSSYGRLVEGDTDSAKDVYRYDTGSGLLIRVSAGEDGYDTNGNDEFDASIAFNGINAGNLGAQKLELGSRVVSDDGSRIVFSTAGPLSPGAVNGLENIYEWRAGGPAGEGLVSMISGGASPSADQSPTISPSGRDVFFVSAQGLVPGDEDGLSDIYDARLGGGFPAVPVSRQPCSGDACQGSLTNPVPSLIAGSVVQEPGDNFAAPLNKTAVPAKKKAVKKHAKRRRAKRKGRKARRAATHDASRRAGQGSGGGVR